MKRTVRKRRRRKRRRRRKNSESRVNVGRTPASLPRLNVLDELNQSSLPASQSELIWKSSTGVCPGDWRSSRAAKRELIIYVSQHRCTIFMYSTRQIDWAYQRVNRSWSAKVRNRSDLEAKEEEEEEDQRIERQWWTYPSVLAPA